MTHIARFDTIRQRDQGKVHLAARVGETGKPIRGKCGRKLTDPILGLMSTSDFYKMPADLACKGCKR